MSSYNSNVISKTFAVRKAFTDVQMEDRILKTVNDENVLQFSRYTTPENRFNEALKDEVVAKVLEETENISHAYGFRKESPYSVIL